MADIPIPPIPPRRAPLIDIMRELEVRPRQRQSQEFDPVAAMVAERRSQSRQPLPLPPIPPAAAPPPQTGDNAEAGTPRDLSSVSPTIRSRLPENNPYVAAAIDIAEKYNLPRDVFLSLVHQESKFDPKAKSPKGAFGLTQLMPGTARDLGVDPRDPMANLDAGARYLRQQIDRFGSLPLALAAYNSGPGRVIKSGNQIPNIRETQNYVSDILRNAGMEGTVTDQRYGFAEGGLAALDEKYADGGRVRRPAAAPVASPFDADYIERLAAQVVGAGEPVAELRSAEGRGFAPMPRSFGEAGQRMSAVIRGDVEPTPEEERQMNVVRGFTEGPASIRAYHGSPYAFERFDISKIGTGEGNQTYGRGLYFAENEDVAKYYRDKLAGSRLSAMEDALTNLPENLRQRALSGLYYNNMSPEDVADMLSMTRAGGAVGRDDLLESFRRAAAVETPRGHMYEVDLNASPRDFLNWDAPLVQQPERAIPFLEDVLRAPRTGSARVLEREMKPIGEAVDLRTPEVAAQLLEAGIPGLRYLDAGSRAGGRGTRNYVMFGDDLIDITRRYAEGGLAALDEKYAEGGTVRRPAAAPVASPFDADYIERLAAQAVGAGEPVAELRSSEGRGFVPMPRSFGEAGQRMSAVIRGDVEPTPEEKRQMNVVRGFTEGPAAIRAYHGSPYAFERFDISKIGTGEGAQAYGRGLYFAESEPVARYYRDTLSKDFVSVDGRRIPEPTAENVDAQNIYTLANHMYQMGINSDQAIESAINRAQKLLPNLSSDDFYKRKEAEKAQDWVNSILPFRGKSIEWMKDPGAMYEVNLNANSRDFLNWDLPLSQQSRDVQESLSRFVLRADPAAARAYDDALLDALQNDASRPLPRMPRDPTGEEIYQRALRMTPEEARIALMQSGIPGTRYLDAGSRGVGGTYNYAVFDPEIIDITRRYAEGGLADLDEKYADGGTVRAPKETTIAGQDHRLAYITPEEAALLKARGGSGRMTEHGVRAYDEGPGGDPSDTSMSDPATQDAAGGNAGQGAGPTGAGAGATGEPGPGPTGAAPTGEGQSEVNTPGQAPGISTQPTTNINIGLEDQANAAAALGALANAPIGFEAIGVRDALDMYDQGRISFAEMVGYGLNNMLGPPGTQIGVNVNPRDQTQTPAYDISIPGLAMGALGMISGIPGLGMLGGRAGAALGNALGIPSVTVEYSPGQFDAPTTATSVGEYSQYGQPEYGTPGLSNIATSMAPATAASLVDWNQIQREASAMNMPVSEYLAMKWRSPATMARGGMANLEEMHAKYAEGGDVRAPAGEVAEYNPEEIDRIARQIHLRFPEEDLIRPGYEDVESPSDLTMRARLMMRGQNVGLPETVGMGGGNDMFSYSTSMRDIPIESEPYGTSQRMLNTNINAVLDAERNARIGAGMLALERSGERGFTGYGPQLSAGYGPASIYGGYQAITPNIPGAKSQGSYVYGGSLNIPIDESGTEANIGGTVMSGRRGQGGGPSGTQIMGSLERPLLGGRLALELAADPSLRHKEILLGYRRAF